MKIQISYIPGEKETADAVEAALRKEFPGAKLRHKEAHPPRKHTYITIPEPRENA